MSHTLKNPDFWLELHIKEYPSGDITMYNFSTRAMAYPTMIQGRVIRNGWSDVESSLSDWRGSREASVINVTLEDEDGLLRILAEQSGWTTYSDAEACLKMLSEEGRHDGLDPRIIHRGFLLGSPRPKSGRKAYLESVDVIGSRFYRLNPETTIQKVFFTKEWLAAAGVTETPDVTIDSTPAIIIGEQSDAGMVDSAGNVISTGVVPVLDLGNYNFNGLPKFDILPPVLSGSVVGTTGEETYHYAVSFVMPNGETAWSNIVTITNSLPASSFSESNYNHLTWTAPAGTALDGRTWQQVYMDQGITARGTGGSFFRVGGRNTNPPTYNLGTHSGGSGTVEDPWYYNDGELDAHTRVAPEKLPRAPEIGTAWSGGDIWGLFVWAIGYTNLLAIYGSDIAEDTEPERKLLDFDYIDLLTPNSAAWPFSNPWIELNGVRLSAFFARGPILKHHRCGTVPFLLNTCGLTETGDDTGLPVTEAGDGYALLINEFLLKNAGEGYRTGLFWPVEEFRDGTSVLEMDVIREFQDTTIEFIGGRGYQMNLILTEKTTISQFEQWFCNTFNCYVGTLDNGQQGVWTINDNLDPTSVRHLRQHIELPPKLDDLNIAEDELENKVSFKFHYDANSKGYLSATEVVTDPISITLHGLRVVQEDALELRCTADKGTAFDAMQRRLFHNSYHPTYQPLRTAPNPGFELHKGGYVRISHPDGLGINGYDNNAFFIVRKRFIINKPYTEVEFVLRDINRIIGPSPSWIGDEEIYPDWDIMGDDGEFGLMGDEADWSNA